MSLTKRILSVLMVAVMMLTVVQVSVPVSEAVSESDYRYNLTDGVAETIEYTGSDENVVIPSSVDGYPLTRIGSGTFFDCSSAVRTITIHSAVDYIAEDGFVCAHHVEAYIVDENNPYYSNDDDGVLFDAEKTFLIQYPLGNTREEYTVPDTVEVIGEAAFYESQELFAVEIPVSVKEIHSGAFSFSSVEEIEYLGTQEQWNEIEKYEGEFEDIEIYFADEEDPEEEITDPEPTAPDDSSDFFYTISDNEAIIMGYTGEGGDVIIPDTLDGYTVTKIGGCAFLLCDSITSVVIPDSVTDISYEAFEYCTNLERVTIGNNVTAIGNGAFYFCTSLKSITIPDSVWIIDGEAFFGCESLESIIISDSVTTINNTAFVGCTSLTNAHYSGTQEQWDEVYVGFGNDYLTDIIHMATDENEDGECDLCIIGDNAPTETTAQSPSVTAAPTAPTDPVGAITTAEPEKSTTAVKEEPTTKAPTTTAPATTLAPTAEKQESPVVKASKPSKVKIKKPKSPKKKQLLVTWNAVKDANGYQISYSTAKKFTKKVTKTKLIKNAKTTKTTLKKLKSGKKYFVKIRAYKTVDGKKLYGAYSKVMSVKVK